MERERGSRLTANRVLLLGAIVAVVLLALASTLGEKNSGLNIGGASLNEVKASSEVQVPRDWVTFLIIPLALAGVGFVYFLRNSQDTSGRTKPCTRRKDSNLPRRDGQTSNREASARFTIRR